MVCRACGNRNDEDASFCEHCGKSLRGQDSSVSAANRWNSLWLGALIGLVLATIAALGYYKFVLPNGVAAVVNGEEITLAEVNARMNGFGNPADLPAEYLDRIRYRVLNDLITERIAWQEAIRAGFGVTREDLDAAYDRLASASGNRQEFATAVRTRYGGRGDFRRSLERALVVRKYIEERITAGMSDPRLAGARVSLWMDDISRKASVRIALAEQLPGAAACCGKNGCAGGGTAGGRCGSVRSDTNASGRESAAREAAAAYWRNKYGEARIEMRVRDLGCHLEIDILTKQKLTRSLRYQNGVITEL